MRTWDRRLGKYQARTFKTEADALAHGKLKSASFTLGQDNAATCTLDGVWADYKAERMEHGKTSTRSQASMQRVVDGLRAAGATDFKSAGFRAAVSRYFQKLDLSRTKAADGRVAVSTRKRMLSQIRALLNFARAAGSLVADPLAGFSPVGAREQDDTTRETFSLAEARALVGLSRPHDPVWVHAMLMLYAGLRESEARALAWSDYDTTARLLWVRKGKGNKVRAVPVQDELAAIIAQASDLHGPTAKVACLPSAPILRAAKGRALIYQHYIALLVDAGITQSRGLDAITGMERRLNRHSCRHTYCAALLATGQPGDALRIIMGHGSEDLTSLYGSQVATYMRQVRAEGWPQGQLHFRSAPTSPSADRRMSR